MSIDFDAYMEAAAVSPSAEVSAEILALFAADLEVDYEAWVRTVFPEQVEYEFAPHQRDLWEWVWSIEDGVSADPLAACWSRGGGKSSSAEMGIAALAARRRRRYCLWVCGTQDQANDHVTDVARRFESSRFAGLYPEFARPQVGLYGNPRGWRRNRLSTAGGFTIDAVGLATGMRGAKIDQFRPDIIVLDDVDNSGDSQIVTKHKIDQLTRSLIPTLAPHGVILAVQNLVIPEGIMARIMGVAEQGEPLLVTARRSGPIPAIRDLVLDSEPTENGALRWFVRSGEPTWVGQGFDACDALLAKINKTPFLIECQHDVHLREGGMFKAFEWMADRWVAGPLPVEPHVRRMRAWDTAWTEPTGANDPDWTVGVLVAVDLQTERFRIEDEVRFRHGSGTVRNLVRQQAEADVARLGSTVAFGVEQEPGPHGRDAAYAWVHDTLAGFTVHRLKPLGQKEQRAEGLAAAMENQLVDIVRAEWTSGFLAELQAFPLGTHDDRVDAAAYAFNWLQAKLIHGQPASTSAAQMAGARIR